MPATATARKKQDAEIVVIFERLKKLLAPYSKQLAVVDQKPGRYCLASVKDVVIAGRPRSEIWFAGVMIQSDYVGFYYMPVYMKVGIKKMFKPELLKLLKGKSCFHVKELTPELSKQIEHALKVGFAEYRKNGWV